jgi:hypothetical protein
MGPGDTETVRHNPNWVDEVNYSELNYHYLILVYWSTYHQKALKSTVIPNQDNFKICAHKYSQNWEIIYLFDFQIGLLPSDIRPCYLMLWLILFHSNVTPKRGLPEYSFQRTLTYIYIVSHITLLNYL